MGGGHGELMLVMVILGNFRYICPVAKGGMLEASFGETTSQLQLIAK